MSLVDLLLQPCMRGWVHAVYRCANNSDRSSANPNRCALGSAIDSDGETAHDNHAGVYELDRYFRRPAQPFGASLARPDDGNALCSLQQRPVARNPQRSWGVLVLFRRERTKS